MTKIYEALEHARREIREVEHVELPAQEPAERPPEPPAEAVPTALRAPSVHELDLEPEMTALYQSINSRLADLDHKVIQFISSRHGEGTSTIIRELAKVITSLMGRSVLLLDIDRRHPNLGAFFECEPPPELDDVVKGVLPIDQAICRVEDTSLFVSPLFQHSVLTPQKLGSEAADELWEQLRRRFEYVLIDSPPVTTSSDGLAIVRKVDGVIFVVEAEKTRWPVAVTAKEKILSHGGNILGMVFNKRHFYIPECIYKRM